MIEYLPLDGLMSTWRKLLEEESEYQWLSFATFSVIILIGAVLISWSSELSGYHEGGINVDGELIDAAESSTIHNGDDGVVVTLNGVSESAPNATCLTQYYHITFACLGSSGLLWFSEEKHPEEYGWIPMNLGVDINPNDVSANNDAILMIVQDGLGDTLSAKYYTGSDASSNLTQHNGDWHLGTMVATEDGWLVAGSWQAPSTWVGANPISPPLFEMILSVTWDGMNAPVTELIFLGDEGVIHSLLEVHGGYIAAGTASTQLIVDNEVSSLGFGSHAAVSDNNGNGWFFGAKGSTTVSIYTSEGIDIEELPEPLPMTPSFAHCNSEGMITVQGISSGEDYYSISIDSHARSSFTSLRGIMDRGFIFVSLLVISIMLWNVTEAVRKGEYF